MYQAKIDLCFRRCAKVGAEAFERDATQKRFSGGQSHFSLANFHAALP